MNFDDINFINLINVKPENKISLNIIKTNIDLSFDNPKFIYDKRLFQHLKYDDPTIPRVEYACNKSTEIVLPQNADNNRYALFWEIDNNATLTQVIESINATSEAKIIPLKLLWKNDDVIRQMYIQTTDYFFNTGWWLDNFPTRTPLEQHQWDNTWSNSFLVSSSFDEDTMLGVATTIPMYNNYAEAVEYINTGELGSPINSDSTVEESPQQENYYYYMELYRTRNSFDNAVLFKSVKLDFNMTPKAKVSGYITNDSPYNVKINQNHTGDYIDGTLTIDDESQRFGTYSNLISNANTTLTYTEEDNTLKADGYYYFANVQTNIPIFGDENDSEKYQRNEIDRSVAKIGVTDKPNRTGTKLSKTENTQIDISNQLSVTYVIDSTGLADIGNALYTTDDDIFTAMESGLKMMGQNMIDVICGLYVTSIDVNQFLSNRHSEDIWLGDYNTYANGITGSNDKTIVLCNTYIAPTFNNFLDYSNVFLSLYLPACGIVPLDASVFLGNYLKIEVAMDIRTHTLKYYIKCNDCIIEMHEGSIGAEIPITGADQIARTRQLQGAFASTFQGIGDFASSNIAGGISDIYNAVAGINARPSIKQSGGTSSGTNCFDPLYCYLIIDTQEVIIPPRLYSEYGYPTNSVQKLNECSGWTEAHDIKLEGTMTNREKEMIKSLFERGVVL